MLGDTAMTKNAEEEKSKLNKLDLDIDRGFELLLRNKRRKSQKPKTFQVKFGKMISFFRREFHFYIEFHIDIRKK